MNTIMDCHSKWIRKSILRLNRIRDSYENRTGMFRMDRNERTWPHSGSVLKEIQERINSELLTNYTEIDCLYKKLANYLGVSENQIYFHSGSDLVIKSIFETYVDSRDKVLIPDPSYAMYGVYAQMYGADIIKENYDSDLKFDIDDYCSSIKSKCPKLVVLENPSGYIGNGYTHEQVKKVIATAYDCSALVLVDEAYIDYVPENSVADLIDEYDNLIIVRTFSKAWGLAGLRAGYALSNPLLISEIFKVMPMHELTSTTVLAVDVVLDHTEEMRTYIEDVIKVREYFEKELTGLGIRFVKSETHFVTACLNEIMDVDEFREISHANKFFLRRPFDKDLLRDWVRIGLLPIDDMRMFVKFMREFIQEESC